MDFLPATRSTYINSTPRRYCAIHNNHFANGEACGKCFRLRYDGTGTGSCSDTQANPAPNAGEAIIHIVDSGTGNHDFDCVESTFESITGYDDDLFPIEYEEVPCETQACEQTAEDCVMHVIPSHVQKSHGYLGSARVVFFNLPTGVKSVKANIGICGEKSLSRSGALWDVSFSAGGCSFKPIIFTATMSDNTAIEIDATEWSEFQDLVYCQDAVWVNPAFRCVPSPTPTDAPAPQPPTPTRAPPTQAPPTQAPTTQAPTTQAPTTEAPTPQTPAPVPVPP